MTRIDYADGTVVWQRSLMAKMLSSGAVVAIGVGIIVAPGLAWDQYAFLSLCATLAAVVVWAHVWRPHLAATADGLIVRRFRDALLVPWSNIACVSVNYHWGISIEVRVGQHVTSAVPKRSLLTWVLQLHSEIDDAVALITVRAATASDRLP